MREPKNQMLGTMVPPLMQLSVNTDPGILKIGKIGTFKGSQLGTFCP